MLNQRDDIDSDDNAPAYKKLLNQKVDEVQSIISSSRQSKSVGWSDDDIETFATGFSLILILLTSTISYSSTKSNVLEMQSDEADHISKALSRLLLRHIKVKAGKKGDVTDAVAIMVGFTTYSLRVYNTLQEKRDNERKASKYANRNNESIEYRSIA